MVLGKLDFKHKTLKREFYISHCTKANSKWIRDLKTHQNLWNHLMKHKGNTSWHIYCQLIYNSKHIRNQRKKKTRGYGNLQRFYTVNKTISRKKMILHSRRNYLPTVYLIKDKYTLYIQNPSRILNIIRCHENLHQNKMFHNFIAVKMIYHKTQVSSC